MEQTQEIAAQMEQAIEQYNEMMEKLPPMFEALREALLEMARIILEALEPIWEAWRRWWFYIKLIHWHVPHRAAKFIANRWPARWLPAGDWRG